MAQNKQEVKKPVEDNASQVKAEVAPKEVEKETNKAPKRVEYVAIDTFLETAKVIYHLSSMEIAGFRGYMSGKHYQKSDMDFVPFLKKYLGRGDM